MTGQWSEDITEHGKYRWYQDEYIGGYEYEDGYLEVFEEYGRDEELDKYSIEVQNGDGYYNSEGRFIRYRNDD